MERVTLTNPEDDITIEFSTHQDSPLTSSLRYHAHDIYHPSALALLMMGSWMEHKMHPTRYIDDNWPILQRIPRSLAFWRAQYYRDAALLLKIAKAWWEPCK
jgi:hypothetical protein